MNRYRVAQFLTCPGSSLSCINGSGLAARSTAQNTMRVIGASPSNSTAAPVFILLTRAEL